MSTVSYGADKLLGFAPDTHSFHQFVLYFPFCPSVCSGSGCSDVNNAKWQSVNMLHLNVHLRRHKCCSRNRISLRFSSASTIQKTHRSPGTENTINNRRNFILNVDGDLKFHRCDAPCSLPGGLLLAVFEGNH